MSQSSERAWVPAFVARHRERFQPPDWPDDATEGYVDYVHDWLAALHTGSVSEDEADRASRRLVLNPPRWKREHIPAVIETVGAMRAERAPAAELGPDEARAASVGCGHCGGAGLAVVWHPDPRPGEPESVGAHCVCPMGRWLRRRTEPGVLRRVPDLVDVLDGRPGWRVDPPWLGAALEQVSPHFTPAELIRDWTARAREQAKAPAPRRPSTPRPTPEQIAADPILTQALTPEADPCPSPTTPRSET